MCDVKIRLKSWVSGPNLLSSLKRDIGDALERIEALEAVAKAAQDFTEVETLEPWDTDAELAFQAVIFALKAAGFGEGKA